MVFQKYLKNHIRAMANVAVTKIAKSFRGRRMKKLFKEKGTLFANLYFEIDKGQINEIDMHNSEV